MRSHSRSLNHSSEDAATPGMQVHGLIVQDDGSIADYEDKVAAYTMKHPLLPLPESSFSSTTDFSKRLFPNLASSLQGLCYEATEATEMEDASRSQLILEQLRKSVMEDQQSAYEPDYSTAFQSFEDALSRLLPYHIFQYWDELLEPHEEMRKAQISEKSEQLDVRVEQIRQHYNRLLERCDTGVGQRYMVSDKKQKTWLLRQIVAEMHTEIAELHSQHDMLVDQGRIPVESPVETAYEASASPLAPPTATASFPISTSASTALNTIVPIISSTNAVEQLSLLANSASQLTQPATVRPAPNVSSQVSVSQAGVMCSKKAQQALQQRQKQQEYLQKYPPPYAAMDMAKTIAPIYPPSPVPLPKTMEQLTETVQSPIATPQRPSLSDNSLEEEESSRVN